MHTNVYTGQVCIGKCMPGDLVALCPNCPGTMIVWKRVGTGGRDGCLAVCDDCGQITGWVEEVVHEQVR